MPLKKIHTKNYTLEKKILILTKTLFGLMGLVIIDYRNLKYHIHCFLNVAGNMTSNGLS